MLPETSQGSVTTPHTRFYIGNLAEEIDEQTLCQYCSDWGDLSEWKLMKEDDTGRSRGYAFVTYVDDNAAQRFLSSFPHYIGHRRVTVKPVIAPKQTVRVPYDAPMARRLLVSHPPDKSVSEEALAEYFSYFGEVKRVVRSFCQGMDCVGYTFVEFLDPRIIDTCVEHDVHTVCGQRLFVRRVVGVEDAIRFETAAKAKRRKAESDSSSNRAESEGGLFRTSVSLLSVTHSARPKEYSSSGVSYSSGRCGTVKTASGDTTGASEPKRTKRYFDP